MMGRWSWLLVAAGALVAFGCSNQGEGERCSRLAGNDGKDDCEVGLRCVEVNGLELCCPEQGTPSDPQCIQSLTGTGGSAGASGSAGAAGSDSDASTDAEQGAD